jgi:glycosyltransferase involved in cell wall biosynthesis
MAQASVILPTYNRAATLPRAIDSVLAQSFSDFELIIVDDASTDATPKVVSRYDDPRIKFLRHETNRGAPAARNTGIEASEGEYIFFLDSDDTWTASKMAKQIDYLEAHSDGMVAVYCDFTNVETTPADRIKGFVRSLSDTTDSVHEGQERIIERILLLRFRLGGSSTLLVRRSVVEAVDGFDERFPRHQDWEFLIRVLRHGTLGYVDEPLVEKYETGAPNADTYRDAKELLLDTFDDDIARLGISRDAVLAAHYHALAKRYFRESQFSTGVTFLKHPRCTFDELPSILFSVAQGLVRRGSQIHPIEES